MFRRGRFTQPSAPEDAGAASASASALASASVSLGEVGVSVGAGPLVPAAGGAVVGPGGEGFQPVVSPAEAGEAVGGGLCGWSALVERQVGDGVGEAAVAGADAAAGENAGAGAGEDLF